MTTHEFLQSYDAKVFEYLLAVSYLLLFVPMWRYVHGAASTATATATAGAAVRAAVAAPAAASPHGWFHLPEGVALHAGHAWARAEADGLVTVGIDDFAQKLVDPEAVRLPRLGERVSAGRPAFAMGDPAATIPVRSPVDGEVVAVNMAVRDDPSKLRDPYGAGWLFKVRLPAAAAKAQLMVGDTARAFLERAAEALSVQLQPELGLVLQDGGTPVHGIARALAGDEWPTLAGRYLGTEPGGEA